MSLVSSKMKNENATFYVPITIDRLKIDIADVYTRLSNYCHANADDFREQITDVISELQIKCNIKAGYQLYNLHFDHSFASRLSIGNSFVNTGKIITSQLKNSEQAASFACTIGPGMENWSRQVMQDGDPALGYWIDLVASLITEKAVNYLHDYIEKIMNDHGLKITNRYSPGYCDWPVSNQHLLFTLFPKNFCGISLNESALMIPIKSVTGIIGIGSIVKYEEYPCEQCIKDDCTYRIIQSNKTAISN